MRRLFRALLSALILAPAALAQVPSATVTLTASAARTGAGGATIPDGSKLCAMTVDASDRPAGYRIGGASGQTTASTDYQDCRIFSGGSIATPLTLINSALSYPVNACVRLTLFAPDGIEVRRDRCAQPGTALSITMGWCTSSGACNYDAYPSGGVAGAVLAAGPVGPAGPAGVQGPAGTVTAVGGAGRPLFVDGITVNENASQNPIVTVNHTTANSGGVTYYGHAYTDDSTFDNSGGNAASAYASYDVRVQAAGNTNIGHIIGYQSLPSTASGYSAHVGLMAAFLSAAYIRGGAVDVFQHYAVTETGVGPGTIGTQYGIYLATMTKGATNWQIYSENGNSYLGGGVILGLNKATYVNGYGQLIVNTSPSALCGVCQSDTPAQFISAATNGTFVNIINTSPGGHAYSFASLGQSGGGIGPAGTLALYDGTTANPVAQFGRVAAPGGSTTQKGWLFNLDGTISYANGSSYNLFSGSPGYGFTGTKTIGGCTLSISNGSITAVSGC